MFKTQPSGGGGVSKGDFGIDLYAKIWKPTQFIYLVFEKKKTHSYT